MAAELMATVMARLQLEGRGYDCGSAAWPPTDDPGVALMVTP